MSFSTQLLPMGLRAGTFLILTVVSSSTASGAWAQSEARAEFRAAPASRAPIIDGALDDDVWQSAPLPTGEFLSYDPLLHPALGRCGIVRTLRRRLRDGDGVHEPRRGDRRVGVCQFTRAFALRGIAQYDSSRKRVLTAFLSSYEPRPGTVVYAGYGSLLEQREFVDGVWVNGGGEYRTTQRGVFFKASYLYRF